MLFFPLQTHFSDTQVRSALFSGSQQSTMASQLQAVSSKYFSHENLSRLDLIALHLTPYLNIQKGSHNT